MVADRDHDFSCLRDLLIRECDDRLNIDRVHTVEEAMAQIEQLAYDLLLCDYQAGNNQALHLLQEMRKRSSGVPVIFLSEHINQAAVNSAVEATCIRAHKANLSEPSLSRAIGSAIAIYCKERQRRKGEDTLRKFGRAVEQTADLIVITDHNGSMEYVNTAFETTTGYSREQAIGQNLQILRSEQQSFQLYQDMWQTVLTGNVFRGVMVSRKKNGDTFTVEKTVTPLRDDDGKITHFVSCDRDITERCGLEAKLQQAQKMDAIGRLAGGVAHDFNNLLMVISAYAELMQDALSPEHPLRHNVQEIMAASRRAADLTRQLLAFGRKQVQALQLLDPNLVIADICRMLPRLIGEDIDLEFHPGLNLGQVRADPVQIEQIMMNLAANARDAMPNGGKLTVETACVRADDVYVNRHSIVPPGDYVLLSVTDTGQGIASQHMAHIFEPFYTTKAEGKGTGLGLATVYGIVKQSGGFVWVYSEPGLGTTFKIYLPRLAAKRPKLSSARPAEQAPLPRGHETVLLVEDEMAVRNSEHEFLLMNGYKVLEASDGEQALAVAGDFAGPIQLMITDVVMPRMGGAKLAQELASQRPGMRVLFVSGYAEKTVLRHGAIDVTTRFLQKPFSLKALAHKIRYVLEQDTQVERGAPRLS